MWSASLSDDRRLTLTWVSPTNSTKVFTFTREAAVGTTWTGAQLIAAGRAAIDARDDWAAKETTRVSRAAQVATSLNTADTNPPTVN